MPKQQTSSSTSLKPTKRKALNHQQLLILDLLYNFRFATSQQIARYLGKKTSQSIQKRLTILVDQHYIAKRYDKSYRLLHRPAAYYLLIDGGRMLVERSKRRADEPINLSSLYRNRNLSEKFIAHCTHILGANLELKALYGSRLEFFVRNELNYPQFDYYPQPLPDAHIRLAVTKQSKKEFFLDIFEASQPYFVLVRRIKKYLQYADSREWGGVGDELPLILLACEAPSTEKRLRKQLAYELRQHWGEEVCFAITTLVLLLTSHQHQGAVWWIVNDEGISETRKKLL